MHGFHFVLFDILLLGRFIELKLHWVVSVAHESLQNDYCMPLCSDLKVNFSSQYCVSTPSVISSSSVEVSGKKHQCFYLTGCHSQEQCKNVLLITKQSS